MGFYSVLFALTVPLAWGFRVVGGGACGRPALIAGALFTAACVSGFLQGFVLFLSLPLDLGAPFGGLTVVGGVVALGVWLFLLHLVVLIGWLATLRAGRPARSPRGRPGLAAAETHEPPATSASTRGAGRSPRCSTTSVLTARVRTT